MRTRRLLLVCSVATVFMATGCMTVGPDYHRPVVTTSRAWSTPLDGGETADEPDESPWWRSFHDPVLESLITRAAESNLTLKIAEARIREARAARSAVAAQDGPRIRAQGVLSRNRFSENGFPPKPPNLSPDFTSYEAGFDAAWELDLFGGTRRAVEAADAGVAASVYDRNDVMRTLLAEVARSYIAARAFQRRLSITHDNIDAEQEVLRRTQERRAAGLATQLDVAQATALLAATNSQVPSLEAEFRNSTYQLDVLLGEEPGKAALAFAKDGDIPAVPPRVPAGLPSDLLERRPDVRRAERQLAAATARIGVATANLFPRFALIGAVGLDSTDGSDWWSPGSRFWSMGPVVSWPIFQAGRIRAGIRAQKARQQQSLANYEQTVLIALSDVERSLTAYAKEQLRRSSLQRSVDANKEALDLANDLYGHGLVDFLRVLTAEHGLYVSQDALVQSDERIAEDLVALYKALGGGWSSQ